MTAYVILVTGKSATITKHYDRVQALAHAGTSDPHGVVVAGKDDLPDAGSDDLAELFYAMVPGSLIADITPAMVFDKITALAPSAFVEPTATQDLPANTPPVELKGTKTMSESPATAEPAAKAPAPAGKKTAPKKAAAAKAKAKAAPKARGKGKPAGKPADFKQVLKGSKRANILELMTGKHDATAIGAKLGIPPSLVSSNIFCLHRDCGIGYSYGANGEITALFPTGKTMADAMKVAGTKPKAAAAKKAPAKKAAAKK